MLLIYLPFGLRRNPVWRDSSNVKRERAVGDGYGIERMSSDSGFLLGIILNFCHFLSDLKGLTLEVEQCPLGMLLLFADDEVADEVAGIVGRNHAALFGA